MEGKKKGFTLVELMVVVGILSVLAAVAAPAYVNYLSRSKENVLRANFVSAVGLVRNEISKRNAGSSVYLSTPAEFAASLNHGGLKSVYDYSADAFATSGSTPGTVVITMPQADQYKVAAFDGLGNPLSGYDVAIVLE